MNFGLIADLIILGILVSIGQHIRYCIKQGTDKQRFGATLFLILVLGLPISLILLLIITV